MMLNFCHTGKLQLTIDRRQFKIILTPMEGKKKKKGRIMSIPLRLTEKTGHESSCGIPQVSAYINFLLVKGSLFKLHRINKINMHFKVRTDLFVSFHILFLGVIKIRIHFKGKLLSTFIFQKITPVMKDVRDITKLIVNVLFWFQFSSNVSHPSPSSRFIFSTLW